MEPTDRSVDPAVVLRAVTAAVMVVDRDHRIVEANEATATLAGVPLGTLIGTPFDLERWRARDHTGRRLEAHEYPVGRALDGEVVRAAELLVDNPERGTVVLMASAVPLRDDDGTVTHAVATIQDVTHTVDWRAQLESSRARLAAVFEHATEPILLFDDQGHYLAANPAAGRLVGRPPQDLVGRHFTELIADLAGVEQRWADFRRSGRVQDQLDVMRSDGTRVRIAAHSVAGIEPGVNLTVWRDVTDQRRAMEALEQAVVREQAALEEQARMAAMKDVFLSAVSHELRTPLTAIAGFNETLLAHADELGPDRSRELLARQHAGIHRLTELLEDLLDLDRLRRGLGLVEASPARLADVVVEAVEAAVDDGAGPVEDLSIDVDDADVVVEVDVAKLGRIVANLVSNALRHTPDGTPVRVRARVQEDTILVEVEDAGPGLPTGLGDDAFTMFVKGGGERDVAVGAGIGLGVVRQFSRLMGGEATAGRGELGGLLVTVTLPVLPEAPVRSVVGS